MILLCNYLVANNGDFKELIFPKLCISYSFCDPFWVCFLVCFFSVFLYLVHPAEDTEHNTTMIHEKANKEFLINAF